MPKQCQVLFEWATYVNGRNSGKVFVVGGEVDSAGDAVGERGELGLDVAHGDHGLRRAVRQAVSPFRNCVAGHCYKKIRQTDKHDNQIDRRT